MKIQSVNSPAFAKYGKVLNSYDFTELLDLLCEISEKPLDKVIYVPSVTELEELDVYGELTNRQYGGMPIQIGYCNGSNDSLNALEYHRDSEIDIAAERDLILLLGKQEEIIDGVFDTEKVEAFLLPKDVAVEVYATTLHYAPCETEKGAGFRCIVVLPRGTNTQMPPFAPKCEEDRWMSARNKWLLAHPDSPEAAKGRYVGLKGKNLNVFVD